MRLVIVCDISDGYTYSYTDTVPVEYESGEAFLVDFESACKGDKSEKQFCEFEFANKTWYVGNFMIYDSYMGVVNYCPPEVYTVDEWFDAFKV